MIRKTMAGLFVACLMSSAAWAQTADELIEKNIQARGGREKLAALQTVRMTGKAVMGPGMEVPFVQEIARPNKMRAELTVQGMTGIQTYDGKEAWSLMPFMGKTEAEPVPADELKALEDQADIDGLLVGYKEQGHQIEYAGKEDLEGSPAHKLKITKKNGDIAWLWLDAEHSLELKIAGKTKARGQEVEVETLFGDYKEIGGIVFPHSIENRAVGMPGGMTVTISKIEINPELSADRFTKPQAAKGAAPKPK